MLLIYVHIPFCIKKCPYCDFLSIPYDAGMEDDYLRAFSIQLEDLCTKFGLFGRKIKTIYLGGGTPSVVSDGLIEKILDSLRDVFDDTDLVEVTVEINPGDVSQKRLVRWKELGINRVSIGVQSFSDKILSVLERRYRGKDVVFSIEACRKVFGDRVSLDLMFGVPGQSLDLWEKDLRKAVDLGMKHISLYCLSVSDESRFYKMYPDFDNDVMASKMYKAADKFLSGYGIRWYEISNFCMEGFEAVHNLGYWMADEFIGLGPSAWSFIDGLRFGCKMSVEGFLSVGCSQDIVYEYDEVPDFVRRCELLALKIRTRWGVGKDEVKDLGLDDVFLRYIDIGWIEDLGNKFRLTLEGRLFADTICEEIVGWR